MTLRGSHRGWHVADREDDMKKTITEVKRVMALEQSEYKRMKCMEIAPKECES